MSSRARNLPQSATLYFTLGVTRKVCARWMLGDGESTRTKSLYHYTYHNVSATRTAPRHQVLHRRVSLAPYIKLAPSAPFLHTPLS
jgi:hypothetical protein